MTNHPFRESDLEKQWKLFLDKSGYKNLREEIKVVMKRAFFAGVAQISISTMILMRENSLDKTTMEVHFLDIQQQLEAHWAEERDRAKKDAEETLKQFLQ